jgi:hypothetical protein
MKSFFLARLRGDAPLQTVFWRDMVLIGTGLNVISSAMMLMLIAAEASNRTALIAHFAPTPWNLFLFYSVWRASDRLAGATGSMVKTCAAGWLALMLII